MSKALDGVRILDFTHVQSGPDLHAAAGLARRRRHQGRTPRRGRRHARPAARHPRRGQPVLHDAEPQQALDHRSTPRSRAARQVLDRLIKSCDVLVENFAPGALDRMGITWEHIQELNPRMIVASVKGFGPGPYEDCKVYENVAQCAGGSASTTGFRRRPADGHRRADRRQRHRPAPGAGHRRRAVPAHHTGRGQKVLAPMQDAVLNLCRVKLRDQQRLERTAHACTSIRSIRTASSATRCRAPAMPRAAASPAPSSSARAGRPTPTPTSTSSPRRRCGRRSAR